MNTLRYLWAHPFGRLALVTIAVSVISLTTHYWLGSLLLAGLRLPTSPYNPPVTPNRVDDQIARMVDVNEMLRADDAMTRHE